METLAKQWGIGLVTAARTSQLVIHQVIHPDQRHFCTEVMQLRYPRLGGCHGCFYTDTLLSKVPSLSGCTMGQVFTNDINFTKFVPMKRKGEEPDALILFMQDIGIPSYLIHSDDAKELTQGHMGNLI